MERYDLTNWVIHFVHKRNPEADSFGFSYDSEDLEYVPLPDGFTYKGEPRFLTNKREEDAYGLAPDDSAIRILQKILHDGYIRAGWSFRKGTPTIYGPKAAVCMTEMPLYALVEYAKKRGNENYTAQYGIAFLKDELFLAGARPVIYGLSNKHTESVEGDPNFGIGLRTLSSESGIGLNEQYRYVYTNLKLRPEKGTDWTHEREWRWADLNDDFDIPGMPVFAKNEKITFSKIIVIVKTNEESNIVIDQLKNLYHSRFTNYEREYDLKVIINTYVLALDEIAKIAKNPSLVKIDDLPLHSIPKIEEIMVSKETLEKVERAVLKASEISYDVTKEFVEKNGDVGPCGYANIVTWKSNSEITQALIDLKLAISFADGYYYIKVFSQYPTQSIDANEAGAKAAAEYLSYELGENFNYQSRWD